MKPPLPKNATRAGYENKLQEWIALWQTAEHPGGYFKIIWDLHRFLEVARKYPPAKTFARMKRDEIAKLIRSEKFLCQLRKDYGDDLWRKIGEDAIQTLIQPSEIIQIFNRLNWFFDEPEATMAYYEEASANPEITDELDRILWGFWFETKRWNKVLNYAERCGWFADPFPIGEQESFLEKAVEVFYALLKTQDIPRMLELLKRLGNHPNPNKKDYLRQLSVLHREEAPPVVQQQIDQLMAVFSQTTKSKSITTATRNGSTVSLSGWSISFEREHDEQVIAAIKANIKLLENSFILTDDRLLEVAVGGNSKADMLCRTYPQPPIPLGVHEVEGKKFRTYVISQNLLRALQELQHS